jgi:hypothetical protein
MSQFLSNPPSVVPTLGTGTTCETPQTEVNVATVKAIIGAMSAAGAMTATVPSKRKIKFIDFGISDGREYWELIVRPNLEEFRRNPTPKSARNLGTSLWEVMNWIWWDRHPTEDDRSPAYGQFCTDQISKCNYVASVREIADAWKHRGLSRAKLKIKTARTNAPTFEIGFDDGTVVSMSDAFEDVVAYVESLL